MAAIAQEMEARLREVESGARLNDEKITSHEKLCAVRYATIAEGHERMEKSISGIHALLLRVGLLLIIGMAWVLTKLVFFS